MRSSGLREEGAFREVVGESRALTVILRELERVAPTDTTVLLCGETGTGKELLTRAVHAMSPRHERPLIKVNCGALAAGVVKSELFGHERGAFTELAKPLQGVSRKSMRRLAAY